MAKFIKPSSKVTDLVYAARAAEAGNWDGLGFSPSSLHSECDRFLWLTLRWAYPKETFDGRMHLLFDSGHYHEAKMVEGLRRAGLEIYEVDPDTGKQFLARAISGHLRGKLDGIIRGVPEAPAKWHVFEAKSHGEKSWMKLKAGPTVKEGKFEHWVQMQVYMHIRGIERALYGAVRKATDDLHFERVYYDPQWCAQLFGRLERIIRMPEPPKGICTKPDDWRGRFCKAKPLCFEASFARLTCRSCLHSTPEFGGDAAWSCARWAKPLSIDEQRDACPAHLYVPALVPGEVEDVDEANETITYTLTDGRTWTDGRDQADAPMAAPEEEE